MLWHMFAILWADARVAGAIALPACMDWQEIVGEFGPMFGGTLEGATYVGVWDANCHADAIAKFMAMVGAWGEIPDGLSGIAWCNPHQVWIDKVNDTLACSWKANMAAGQSEEDAYEAALRENVAIHGRTGAEMALCELREWA